MPHRSLLLALVTATTLSACGDVITSPDLFPTAQAYRTCGPTDGPAVAIELIPELREGAAQSAIRVAIWQDLGVLSGRTFRLEQNSNDGFASRFWIPTSIPSLFEPLTGSVEIRRVNRDSSVVGFLDVRFTDGTRFTREFTARWQPTSRLACG